MKQAISTIGYIPAMGTRAEKARERRTKSRFRALCRFQAQNVILLEQYLVRTKLIDEVL